MDNENPLHCTNFQTQWIRAFTNCTNCSTQHSIVQIAPTVPHSTALHKLHPWLADYTNCSTQKSNTSVPHSRALHQLYQLLFYTAELSITPFAPTITHIRALHRNCTNCGNNWVWNSSCNWYNALSKGVWNHTALYQLHQVFHTQLFHTLRSLHQLYQLFHTAEHCTNCTIPHSRVFHQLHQMLHTAEHCTNCNNCSTQRSSTPIVTTVMCYIQQSIAPIAPTVPDSTTECITPIVQTTQLFHTQLFHIKLFHTSLH